MRLNVSKYIRESRCDYLTQVEVWKGKKLITQLDALIVPKESRGWWRKGHHPRKGKRWAGGGASSGCLTTVTAMFPALAFRVPALERRGVRASVAGRQVCGRSV